MRLASFTTLILAAVLASPALWHAVVVRDLDAKTALIRYLIAVPVAAIMLGLLRMITSGYHRASDGSDAPRPPLRVTAVTGEPMPKPSAPQAPPPEQGG